MKKTLNFMLLSFTIIACASIPNNNSNTGKLSGLSFTLKNKAFMTIFSTIQITDATQLWNDFCVLENSTNIKDVTMFINSPGGDAFSGLALGDQIDRAQRKHFHITGYASGIVASAALPVFATCNIRIAAPGTLFMVHKAGQYNSTSEENEKSSHEKMLNLINSRYIDVLVENSKLNKEQWGELLSNESWFTVEKAKEIGLVDRIE